MKFRCFSLQDLLPRRFILFDSLVREKFFGGDYYMLVSVDDFADEVARELSIILFSHARNVSHKIAEVAHVEL